MTTSESKGRFFLQNESNQIDSNRELECSTRRRVANLDIRRYTHTHARAYYKEFFGVHNFKSSCMM